jgi:subtilisin family serine protease
MLLRSKDLTVPQMLKVLKKDPRIEKVSPNWYRHPLEMEIIPNDKFFRYQWGLQKQYTDAVDAWNITNGSKSVVVAVVDTGIDYKHPDLKDNIWHNPAECNGQPGVDDDNNGYVDDCIGYDFGDNDNDPMDLSSEPHVTHVAGIIGAVGNNQEGVSGVNWNVSILPAKVSDSEGNLYDSYIIDALNYIITCLLYTSPSPRDGLLSRMPSSA